MACIDLGWCRDVRVDGPSPHHVDGDPAVVPVLHLDLCPVSTMRTDSIFRTSTDARMYILYVLYLDWDVNGGSTDSREENFPVAPATPQPSVIADRSHDDDDDGWMPCTNELTPVS